MFCFINLLHISVIRPQQSDSWASQTEEETQKAETLARIRPHLHITHANLLPCVGSFSEDRIRPFSQVHWQQAWGNSHKLQSGKFQHGKSTKFPVRVIKLQRAAQRGCSAFSLTDLQNSAGWFSEWRDTILALLWAGGGSRWRLGSLPTKPGPL